MRWFTAALMAATLSGCSAPADDKADDPAAAATTYAFTKADLYRAPPKDICRRHDPDFLLHLMGRVDAALPLDAKGSAQFDSFFVQDRFDGKGKEAVLRFTARHGNAASVPMFALAPFAQESCSIGKMTGSVGTDLLNDAGNDGFAID
ncbi:hypothetical protein [Sphingopyxis sp. NFH-91]|uniref:hypothetical protein n=1 Tax=Sphingopyxis sp. NFH-91 TaxID=2744457 RepID=UPI001F2D6317|nr:hypothetical protein [Sphingopyxis sp. NFH-91]